MAKRKRPSVTKAPYKFVEVLWRDAEGDHSWTWDSQVGLPQNRMELCQTRGWAVKRDDMLHIASTVVWAPSSNEWLTSGLTAIPTGMIVWMKESR